MSLHPHAPHRLSPTPRRWAVITACAVSPCPSRLCTPRCLAPRGCTYCVAVLLVPAYSLLVRFLFFFFLLTSSFAVQSPCPNGMMVMWPRGRDDDDRSYSTTQHDDSHHESMTATPHGAMTATVTPNWPQKASLSTPPQCPKVLLQSAQKSSPSRQSVRPLVQPAHSLTASLMVPVWSVFALGWAPLQ